MNLEKLSSLVCRSLFFAAFALLAVAILERALNFGGFTVLKGFYQPSRLLELAATALLFVVALLLRQIREQLRKAA